MGALLEQTPNLLAEGHVSFGGFVFYVAFVLVVMFALMAMAKTGLSGRVFTKPLTQCAEQLYLFIENLCVGTIGPHGRKYIPMIMTFWLVIFVGNMTALFFPTSPTAILGFNLGMALISIIYVQVEGVKQNGLFGHLSHFAGPKLGIALLPITLMLFLIEIVSELMKNVSLSLRLFGNMNGGHQAVMAMNKLGEHFYIPFGAFLLPVKLLTAVVQTMIFCLLTCVYISLVTHHDDEHGHGEAAAAH